MSVHYPILAAVTIPLLVLVYLRSRGLEPAGRWSLRAAFVLLWLAIAGLHLRCDRPLRIVVMTDVSASTRGATYHDPLAVQKRLAPLLAGRAFETIYFADGVATGPAIVTSDRTRLPASDADAALLLSDGRFAPPASTAATYPIIDPALDAPEDARVDDIRFSGDQARVTTHAPAPSTLDLNGATVQIPAGPFTATARGDGSVWARVISEDRWPENGQMTALAPASKSEPPWVIRSASELPTDAARYLSVPAIAVDASIELDTERQQRLVQYTRDLGGTLVLTGSPRLYAGALRPIAPISASPPEPESGWYVLLDASGSMSAPAPGAARWQVATSAAQSALRALDELERITLATFNRTLDVHLTSVPPAQAIDQLGVLSRSLSPTGPTALRGALEQIAKTAPAKPTRLLILTDADADLGDLASLVSVLQQARLSVFLLATNDAAPVPLQQLVQQTGGQLLARREAGQWTQALQSLVASARGEDRLDADATLAGTGALAGLSIELTSVFRGFARSDATTLAQHRDAPAIATWRVGTGQVVSVAGDVTAESLARLLDRLKRPPVDPRFATEWDLRNERVRVIAIDAGRPMNALSLSLARRDGSADRVTLTQTAPGTYEAPLPRRATPTLATIDLDGQILARQSIPSRYAREFDQLGNDHVALADLATRTGGRVIEPGDNSPIAFARATEWRDATPWLATIASVLLGVAIVFMRAPYLADVLAKRVIGRLRRGAR